MISLFCNEFVSRISILLVAVLISRGAGPCHNGLQKWFCGSPGSVRLGLGLVFLWEKDWEARSALPAHVPDTGRVLVRGYCLETVCRAAWQSRILGPAWSVALPALGSRFIYLLVRTCGLYVASSPALCRVRSWVLHIAKDLCRCQYHARCQRFVKPGIWSLLPYPQLSHAVWFSDTNELCLGLEPYRLSGVVDGFFPILGPIRLEVACQLSLCCCGWATGSPECSGCCQEGLGSGCC